MTQIELADRIVVEEMGWAAEGHGCEELAKLCYRVAAGCGNIGEVETVLRALDGEYGCFSS